MRFQTPKRETQKAQIFKSSVRSEKENIIMRAISGRMTEHSSGRAHHKAPLRADPGGSSSCTVFDRGRPRIQPDMKGEREGTLKT